MRRNYELVQRVELIKKVCAGQEVLHLGCTDYPYTEDAIKGGTFLHSELSKISSSLYGFDFDRRGIDLLSSHGYENLYQADLEKLDDVVLSRTFDCIVAGEMIEHLSNPGLFLKGIQRFMRADSKLILTTVNAYCALRFAQYFISGKGGDNEPVHPDHVSYFSQHTMKVLVEKNGLKLDDFFFYDIGTEHRKFVRFAYLAINDIAVKLTPQLSDGIIAICSIKN